jgi:hypothetical protein
MNQEAADQENDTPKAPASFDAPLLLCVTQDIITRPVPLKKVKEIILHLLIKLTISLASI